MTQRWKVHKIKINKIMASISGIENIVKYANNKGTFFGAFIQSRCVYIKPSKNIDSK